MQVYKPWHLGTLSIVLFSSWLVISPSCRATNVESRRLNDEGISLYRAHSYDQAVLKFQAAIEAAEPDCQDQLTAEENICLPLEALHKDSDLWQAKRRAYLLAHKLRGAAIPEQYDAETPDEAQKRITDNRKAAQSKIKLNVTDKPQTVNGHEHHYEAVPEDLSIYIAKWALVKVTANCQRWLHIVGSVSYNEWQPAVSRRDDGLYMVAGDVKLGMVSAEGQPSEEERSLMILVRLDDQSMKSFGDNLHIVECW